MGVHNFPEVVLERKYENQKEEKKRKKE